MKLWLISQKENRDYDTYDSAVVAAETKEEAVSIHPGPYAHNAYPVSSWAPKEQVQANYIGHAKIGTKAGVICASFNAG